MITNTVYKILDTNATVKAATGGRIYPLHNARQAISTPYVIIHQISVVPTHVKGEASPQDEVRIQVNSYHEEINDLNTIMTAIRAALDQYSGTVDGVVISHAYFDDESIDYDEDTRLYKGMQDFILKHNRS